MRFIGYAEFVIEHLSIQNYKSKFRVFSGRVGSGSGSDNRFSGRVVEVQPDPTSGSGRVGLIFCSGRVFEMPSTRPDAHLYCAVFTC